MIHRSQLLSILKWMADTLGASLRDLAPIAVTVCVFQLLVFRQPLENTASLVLGLVLVVLGLSLFRIGLEQGLFPLGEQMAHDFARKGSLVWLILFAFALGFGTTFAEPALISISQKAAQMSAESVAHPDRENAVADFAMLLRFTVAVSVGSALVLGVLRIIFAWPVQYIIMVGYFLVICLTPFAPTEIVAVAYDSGGVTTSTMTVPLTTALGVGLASSIRGRNPLLDGFGMIALASLTPIIFVLILGIMRF